MRKVEMARTTLQRHIQLLRCPVCGEAFAWSEPNSLVCSQRHCFDLSRQGYLHLLPGGTKASKYDRSLFESRLAVHRAGCFAPLLQAIQTALESAFPGREAGLNILDAGCGEGSHLASLIEALRRAGHQAMGVGLDIAREGIRVAAREYPGLIWCVADLARSPLQERRFDVILNILSPANYAEFDRLLNESGILIKVVPQPDYLHELRTAFYRQTEKADYTNQDVVHQFAKHFQLLASQPLRYSLQLEQSELEHLIRMTPLSWQADEAQIQRVVAAGLEQVTVDVLLLLGRARG